MINSTKTSQSYKQSKDLPDLYITPRAFQKIEHIYSQSLGLNDQYLRIQIDGKGPSGFSYAVGPTKKEKNDLELDLKGNRNAAKYKALIDPFTASHLSDCTIDYIQDFGSDYKGLIIINHTPQKRNLHNENNKLNSSEQVS